MMGDSFQGTETILLQRGTSNFPYRFQVTVASSSNRTDGILPFGSTVCSFTVLARLSGTTASSTAPIVSKALDGNQMIARLAWTTAISQGMYQLEFKIIASINGSTYPGLRRQLEFSRLILKERR